MTIEVWDRQPLGAQEAFVGRPKDSGAPRGGGAARAGLRWSAAGARP